MQFVFSTHFIHCLSHTVYRGQNWRKKIPYQISLSHFYGIPFETKKNVEHYKYLNKKFGCCARWHTQNYNHFFTSQCVFRLDEFTNIFLLLGWFVGCRNGLLHTTKRKETRKVKKKFNVHCATKYLSYKDINIKIVLYVRFFGLFVANNFLNFLVGGCFPVNLDKKNCLTKCSKHQQHYVLSIFSSSSFDHLLSLCKIIQRAKQFMYKHMNRMKRMKLFGTSLALLWKKKRMMKMTTESWLWLIHRIFSIKIAYWSKICNQIQKWWVEDVHSKISSCKTLCLQKNDEWNIQWHIWQWTMNEISYWLKLMEFSFQWLKLQMSSA